MTFESILSNFLIVTHVPSKKFHCGGKDQFPSSHYHDAFEKVWGVRGHGVYPTEKGRFKEAMKSYERTAIKVFTHSASIT